MNNERWFCAQSEEHLCCESDTREEAIDRGREHYCGDAFLVVKGEIQDYSTRLHFHQIIESLECNNEDLMGEDGDFIVDSRVKERDLEDMVEAAIKEWATKHNISLRAWALANIGEFETIPEL